MPKDRRWLVILVTAAIVLPFSGCTNGLPDGVKEGFNAGLSAVVQGWIESILGDLAPK